MKLLAAVFVGVVGLSLVVLWGRSREERFQFDSAMCVTVCGEDTPEYATCMVSRGWTSVEIVKGIQ